MRGSDDILKKLISPECLFEGEKEQSNCPICLEDLDHNSPPHVSQSLMSPRASQSLAISKMKSEKMRGGENDFNLTILCCHTFHWMCLKNWNDTTCPLCRYLQSPTESSSCDECGATEKLWMCLICGLIGCFNVQAF